MGHGWNMKRNWQSELPVLYGTIKLQNIHPIGWLKGKWAEREGEGKIMCMTGKSWQRSLCMNTDEPVIR